MGAIKQALRYVIAILVSPMLGALFAIPYSIGLDIIYGGVVTGGNWALTTPNVLVAIFIGLVTGWFAGWIAGRRGKLIGTIANFACLIFIIGFSLAINRDLIGGAEAHHQYATKISLWTWIGLIPAIIAGHFAVKFKDIPAPDFFAVAAQAMGLCSKIFWLIFHLYTVYVAFKMAGLFGAFLSLIFPAMSEIFWFLKLWNISHQFVNLYSARLFLAAAATGVALGLGLIGAYLESRRAPTDLQS